MTFEEYKEQVEVFRKIDTAEQLAFYKQQYENHLLHKEDQNYFEPFKDSPNDYLSSVYDSNLNRIFNLDNINEKQAYFLVKPSFEPEYLLVLTEQERDYLLTCTKLAKNYWSIFYADNRVTAVDKLVFQLKLNKNIGHKLLYILNKTINSARLPKGKTLVLDGVVYVLSKVVDGNVKSVFKHSPNSDTNSGRLISIMKDLYNITQNIDIDNSTIKSLETKIDLLID